MDTFPEHVNVREQMGCTPLHLAAGEGEFEVAKTLLKNVSLIQRHSVIIYT